MPNAFAHRAGAAITVGTVIYQYEKNNGESTSKPITGAGIAAVLGTLPDIIEPACSPNHRQFFHSFGMFGLVGLGLYKLNQWEPEDGFDEALRFVLMAASGAYLVHLAMDSSTPKSLPLIGKV